MTRIATPTYAPFFAGARGSRPKDQSALGQALRKETAAVRLMHSKFGVRRSLSKVQIQKAAEAFDANGDYLSASKKLIDTRNQAFRACTQSISRARAHWGTMTVPYPIVGIRLIRKELIPAFDKALIGFRIELNQAARQLQDVYQTLRTDARTRLGDLFNPADYPTSIRDHFALSWDYPSVEPPDYLKQLNPKLYEQEQQKVNARFEEAMHLAEEAFAVELQKLVSHLVDKLSGDNDGKPKVFRNSAVENLTEFFDKFRSLSSGSSDELNQLVEQAEQVVSGVDVNDLRKDGSLRTHIAADLGQVQQLLDGMIVDKPTRAIDLEDDTEDRESDA